MRLILTILLLLPPTASYAQAPVYYGDNDSNYQHQNYQWDSYAAPVAPGAVAPEQAQQPTQLAPAYDPNMAGGYAPITEDTYSYDPNRQVYMYRPQEAYDPIYEPGYEGGNNDTDPTNPFYYSDPYAIGKGVERLGSDYYGDMDSYYSPTFDYDFYTR